MYKLIIYTDFSFFVIGLTMLKFLFGDNFSKVIQVKKYIEKVCFCQKLQINYNF